VKDTFILTRAVRLYMGGIKNGSNDKACLDVRQRVVRGSTVTADHRIPGTEI